MSTLKVERHVRSWTARRDWFESSPIFDSMAALKAADRTIGPIRVAKTLDFISEERSAEWTQKELAKLRQEDLFEQRRDLEKIPYRFRLIWKDDAGEEHDHVYLAWEVCQTWRNWRGRYGPRTIDEMRRKWLNDVCGPRRDIAFIVGNLARFRQTFIVCDIYNPPKDTAHDSLF